jgi:hypothetical protein
MNSGSPVYGAGVITTYSRRSFSRTVSNIYVTVVDVHMNRANADLNYNWNMVSCLVFSLLSKYKSRLIKSPVCLSVCLPLITSEPLGRSSWYLVGRWRHSRGPRCNNFQSHSFHHFKMVGVKISNLQPCPAIILDWKSRHVFCQRQWN